MKTEYFEMGGYRLGPEIGKIRKELKEPNLSYALGFEKYLQLQNRKDLIRYRRLNELRYCLNLLGDMDAKKATRDDIENLILKINIANKATISKGKIKLTLKSFYRWLYRSKNYPKVVEWVKIDNSSRPKLPEELLREEEILQLIGACRNDKHKAVIALLWDTGIRIGELLGLKIKDVVLKSDELSYIIVSGKTGMRRIPIVFSVPYLSNHINSAGSAKETVAHYF